MDPSLQPLLRRLEQLSDQFRELREGVQKALLVAELDPEMALTRARKVLEYVVRDVYQHRINEPPGTRPLEGLLQRLVKDGFFPDRLDAYANTIRKLGNVGTHTFGEKITAADVYQSLSQLTYILEWYFEQERPEALAGQPPQLQPPPPPVAVEPPKLAASAVPGTPAAVVPKGLRSFDANDADFFLELLPGPRDKDGLPESVRFWKHRVEERDEPTFTVGVIYGPSGCGKSSLVKAGLLPRLAKHVLSIYVEATAHDTEARLLKGLRKRCPSLPAELDLTGAVAALGRGNGLSNGQKVFIVLDQFEQWLHAKRGEGKTELAQALRQCDGEHIQCVVLVRDDFWLGLSRFMGALHIELVQGQNIALVDLFDPIHARTVLASFGRAFGRLPASPSREQESFLDQTVAGLSQDGRVVPVRLALFGEMVKGKPWTPATLREVGGTEGVGVTFLEETFSSRTASPRHRSHEQATRAVLKVLLPEQGSDIRGNMKSHGQLLEASGYARRPQEFEELLRILDGEVRLITPTEPGGGESEAGEGQAGAGERYYQLTHDYLVHSLREWLTRKQTETRRGRAELLLADRAAIWDARQKDRELPYLFQWTKIQLLTRKKDWTPPQRKMMRQASLRLAVRAAVLVVSLALLLWSGWQVFGRLRAQSLVESIITAETADVSRLMEQLPHYRRWADPALSGYAQSGPDDSKERLKEHLHASLALLPVDDGQLEYLYGRLLDAEPQEVAVIRDFLRPHGEKLVERLWGVLEDRQVQPGRRFRAACALAGYDVTGDDANRQRWEDTSPFVADQLLAAVQRNPSHYDPLLKTLGPVRDRLVGPLSTVFRSKERPSEDRNWATNILAEYAADRPEVLAELAQDADERQFAVLFPRLEADRKRAVTVMTKTVDLALESRKTDEAKEVLAHHQANAAVILVRMGQAGKVWPLLKHSPDPRVRSYLIHRLSQLEADPRAIIQRLGEEPDVSIRRALLLALGEYDEKELPPGEREVLLPRLFGLYRDDPDAGLHGAAEWLLLRWGQQAGLKGIEDEGRGDGEEVGARREARLGRIRQGIMKDKGRGQWYVNGQGQTMVVIPGSVTFLMGSPPSEAGREGGAAAKIEMQHEKLIVRSFAIAAREVTVEQFLRFRKDHDYKKDCSPTGDSSVNNVTWYDAAAYCNWLSEREGIDKDQWCYLPNKDGKYVEGMKLAPGYLHKAGYRLPSEAEWEYACRAGAVTSRYYGETEGLLGKYAWYTKNSQDRGMLPGVAGGLGVPGACLKPNDFGLFDMLGNALEWCQESVGYYSAGPGGKAAEDVEDEKDITDKRSRMARGGSFGDRPGPVRSAFRFANVPTVRHFIVGFRPARTFR